MLEALIAGQRDPDVLADLAKRRLRAKIPALTLALEGRFEAHHAFLARVHLDLIDRHTVAIDQLTARIEQVMEPFRGLRDLICTIPGIATSTADVVLAEIGTDMSRFPTADHLASWAGTTPGNNESAGKVKSSTTRPGNPYLQGALGAAAMSCAQHPGTYFGAKYRRIATRRGPQKANVAIQHAMLIAIWHIEAPRFDAAPFESRRMSSCRRRSIPAEGPGVRLVREHQQEYPSLTAASAAVPASSGSARSRCAGGCSRPRSTTAPGRGRPARSTRRSRG